MPTESAPTVVCKKSPPGATWKENEAHDLPENRLWIVFIGLMGCLFLAAIDQTIVATALPTIVGDIGGGENYSWVGSAYLLAAATVSTVNGRLSDLIGRKPILYSSVTIFLIGSALCGAAQNSVWLIVCRAVQGVGGGGIIQMVNIVISDIVPLTERGKAVGLLGSCWGIASVAGPLLGGVLTDHVSWRWCFYINLPTGGIAAVILFFFLNLNPPKNRTLKELSDDFDYIGLGLLVTGVICILIGFNSSETAWRSAETITLLTVGGLLIVVAGINECYTKKSPIVPPRLFRTRTTTFILISTCLQALVFFTGAFYLPLYYQILGSSATGAGIRMLPFSLGASLVSAISGVIVSITKDYRIIMRISWAIFILGYGLMTMLDSHSNEAEKELYPLVAAIGMGALFQVPLIGLQAAMPIKDMATSTAAFILIRTLGGTVGISIGQAVFSSTLNKRISKIPNAVASSSAGALSQSVRHLKDIPDPIQRVAVIQAYAKSISSIWVSISQNRTNLITFQLTMTPVVGVGFLLVLLVRRYTLERIIRRGNAADAENDVEKGESPHSEDATPTAIGLGDPDDKMDTQASVDRVDAKDEIKA